MASEASIAQEVVGESGEGRINELPRRKQRGINKENIFNIAASGGEYNPERFIKKALVPQRSKLHNRTGVH